ncbi:DUF2169 domain-containing protein [Sorangium sp. So ce136]|uniref:DUF2169 family type VI secretion system accessory protein n=1 Tax=Sorangium sp. So ce136 TaxID=3133284 RepID=UPI003F0C790F
MDVVAFGPLCTASLLWRRSRGDWAQTIVCKATFNLLPDVSPLASEQERPNENDKHWDGDPARSLYSPSDLVPFKPRADVLLVGNAFAPRKEPVRALVARLAIGSVDKSIEIYCDRAWTAEGKLHEGPWFSSMPLRYERAAGGPETWNPVGMGHSGRLDAQGLLRLANLQPRGFRLGDPSTRLPPVGFGPIAPSWPERARKLVNRTAWSERDWHRLPMPEDLDTGWFNAAPVDQQIEVIRGDERLVLENLHREHARLETALAGLRARACVDRGDGGEAREIQMICDTLWIDTDRAVYTLTWRGVVPLQTPEQPGRILVATAERGRSVDWADLKRRGPDVVKDGTGTVDLRDEWGTQRLDSRSQSTAARSAGQSPLPFARPPAPSQPDAPPLLPPPPVQPPGMVPLGNAGLEASGARLSWGEAAVLGKAVAAPLVASAQPAAPDLGPLEPVLPAAPKPKPKAGAWVPPGSTPENGADARAGSGAGASKREAAGVEGGRAPVAIPAPAPSRPGASSHGADVIELLWFDPEQVARIRKHPGWKKLIADVKARARDEEVNDAEPREKRQEAKDRRDVLAVLRGGDPAGVAGLAEELAAAMEDGTFAPPLVLVDGALEFPFDEKQTLEATMALVAPFTAGDKRLKEQSDTIGELLKSPWLEKGSAGLDGYTTRLREAFVQTARGLPPGYLEAHTERLLLEQRHYQKRTVLGQAWIRALLTPAGPGAGGGAGAGEAIPTYLPERLAKELPMFQRFRARAVVEVRLQLDQFEVHPSALRVVALGRVVGRPGRR